MRLQSFRINVPHSTGLLVVAIIACTIIAMLFFVRTTGSANEADSLSGPARVIDGDTIELSGTTVRLFGIDAPEQRQECVLDGQDSPCGLLATRHLESIIGGRIVHCAGRSNDRYNRVVAICEIDGKDISERMVADGWAIAFVRYSTQYTTEEKVARESKRGMWAGHFQQPEDWRATKG